MARSTREMWAKRVARWRASGLTARQFTEKLGVSEASLRWWSWRLGSGRRRRSESTATEPAAAAVSPLTFVEMTTAVRGEMLEVVLVSGTRLRVPADFDAGVVARLLDVLERRR